LDPKTGSNKKNSTSRLPTCYRGYGLRVKCYGLQAKG
jgi:hypothetical protein